MQQKAGPHTPRCQYFIPAKKRQCKFQVRPGQLYCGNHLFVALQQGEKRVPCPVDPRHTVLETELWSHIRKCPKAHELQQQQAQAYYEKDTNAGTDDEADQQPQHQNAPGHVLSTQDIPHDPAVFSRGLATTRLGKAKELGPHRFMELVHKVEAAYAQLHPPGGLPTHIHFPEYCNPYMIPSASRPLCPKHAFQQASIIGNMQGAGLLPLLPKCTLVEFGAGKGYLSDMIAECCGVKHVVLMDCRGCFKLKADRSLRKCIGASNLQRLTCPIQDFRVGQVPGLEGGRRPWVAAGKHLCGAASDFMLRSCARAEQDAKDGQFKGDVVEQATTCAGRNTSNLPVKADKVEQHAKDWPIKGDAAEQVAEDQPTQADEPEQNANNQSVKGDEAQQEAKDQPVTRGNRVPDLAGTRSQLVRWAHRGKKGCQEGGQKGEQPVDTAANGNGSGGNGVGENGSHGLGRAGCHATGNGQSHDGHLKDGPSSNQSGDAVSSNQVGDAPGSHHGRGDGLSSDARHGNDFNMEILTANVGYEGPHSSSATNGDTAGRANNNYQRKCHSRSIESGGENGPSSESGGVHEPSRALGGVHEPSKASGGFGEPSRESGGVEKPRRESGRGNEPSTESRLVSKRHNESGGVRESSSESRGVNAPSSSRSSTLATHPIDTSIMDFPDTSRRNCSNIPPPPSLSDQVLSAPSQAPSLIPQPPSLRLNPRSGSPSGQPMVNATPRIVFTPRTPSLIPGPPVFAPDNPFCTPHATTITSPRTPSLLPRAPSHPLSYTPRTSSFTPRSTNPAPLTRSISTPHAAQYSGPEVTLNETAASSSQPYTASHFELLLNTQPTSGSLTGSRPLTAGQSSTGGQTGRQTSTGGQRLTGDQSLNGQTSLSSSDNTNVTSFSTYIDDDENAAGSFPPTTPRQGIPAHPSSMVDPDPTHSQPPSHTRAPTQAASESDSTQLSAPCTPRQQSETGPFAHGGGTPPAAANPVVTSPPAHSLPVVDFSVGSPAMGSLPGYPSSSNSQQGLQSHPVYIPPCNESSLLQRSSGCHADSFCQPSQPQVSPQANKGMSCNANLNLSQLKNSSSLSNREAMLVSRRVISPVDREGNGPHADNMHSHSNRNLESACQGYSPAPAGVFCPRDNSSRNGELLSLGWNTPAGVGEGSTRVADVELLSVGRGMPAGTSEAFTGAETGGLPLGQVTPVGATNASTIVEDRELLSLGCATPASVELGGLQAIALAPCCHHRCTWHAYVGKQMFRSIGITGQEFELISWMTGWALCGHDAPAGMGDLEEDDVDNDAEHSSAAVQHMVHHKLDASTSGDEPHPAPTLGLDMDSPQPDLTTDSFLDLDEEDLGFLEAGDDIALDPEMDAAISGWMKDNGSGEDSTGLSERAGDELAANIGNNTNLGGGQEAAEHSAEEAEGVGKGEKEVVKEEDNSIEGVVKINKEADEGDVVVPAEKAAVKAESGVKREDDAVKEEGAVAEKKRGKVEEKGAVKEEGGHQTKGAGKEEEGLVMEEEYSDDFDPACLMSRSERMALGLKCKLLIDFGRKAWMEARGWSTDMMVYIQPEVSGENKLFVARCK